MDSDVLMIVRSTVLDYYVEYVVDLFVHSFQLAKDLIFDPNILVIDRFNLLLESFYRAIEFHVVPIISEVKKLVC